MTCECEGYYHPECALTAPEENPAKGILVALVLYVPIALVIAAFLRLVRG